MSEFDILIATICEGSSSVENRSAAERRLVELLSNGDSVGPHLNTLHTANDTAIFFVCIGLQRLIWRGWGELDAYLQEHLVNTITTVLTSRLTLQQFSKAKLEQVLATICICSSSIQPAVTLLSSSEQQGSIVGLSCMRTVLDTILSDDAKIDQNGKAILISLIDGIIAPLTNLACGNCVKAIQNYNEDTHNSLLISLEILKIIVGKLQIGSHITLDVLDLLFSIAEMGAEENSVFHSSSLSAMEILTEVMYKRYIPVGSDGQGVKVLMRIVGKVVALLKNYRQRGRIEDSAIVMTLLEFISVFAESHLERCLHSTPTAQTSSTFFASSGSGSNGAGEELTLQQNIAFFFDELVQITTVSMNPEILVKLVSVWKRLVNITSIKSMIVMSATSNNNICVPIVSHLLQSCLIMCNKYLQDDMEVIIDSLEFSYDNNHDHIIEILYNILTTRPSPSKEENESVASITLIREVVSVIVEFLESKDALQWIQNTISNIMSQHMNTLLTQSSSSSKAVAAVDLQLLLRLFVLTPFTIETAAQLVDFLFRILESELDIQNVKKEVLSLSVNISVLLGMYLTGHRLAREIELTVMFLTSTRLNPAANAAAGNPAAVAGGGGQNNASLAEWAQHLERFFGTIIRCFNLPICNIVQSQQAVQQQSSILQLSIATLFTQAISTFAPMLDLDSPLMKTLKTSLENAVDELLNKRDTSTTSSAVKLSLESYSLLVVSKDSLNPASVAPVLVSQYIEAMGMLEGICTNDVNVPPTLENFLDAVYRMTASIDILARNHVILKAGRRQQLIAMLTPLQSALTRFISCMLMLALRSWRSFVHRKYFVGQGGGDGFAAAAAAVPVDLLPLESINKIVRLSLAMTCSLLQRIGKKTFGRNASEIFQVCVTFIETCVAKLDFAGQQPIIQTNDVAALNAINSTNPLVFALFDSEGLKFLLEVLQLSQKVALSTAASSLTVESQVSSTLRLLRGIMPYLGDERVCAEILQATLTTGIVAVNSYWQKAPRSLPFLSSIQQPPGLESMANNNGINVKELTGVLVSLFIGSLGDGVPPHDTALALSGLIQLKQQHEFLSVPWFQLEFWLMLFMPIVRALVVRSLVRHNVELEQVFIALCDARLAHLRGLDPPSPGAETTGAGFHFNGTEAGDDSNTANANIGFAFPVTHHQVDERMPVKVRDFWFFLANEVVKLAGEYQCAAEAHELIAAAVSTFVQSSKNGPASGKGSEGEQCVVKIISPVSTLIARRL